jgi:L,D-transpeptidase catalytic domain
MHCAGCMPGKFTTRRTALMPLSVTSLTTLREAMSWSAPFHVWMPLAQYFYGGYAMHEFAAVPAYPASHGCVRVPQSESRAVWQFGSIGMRVWTRR